MPPTAGSFPEGFQTPPLRAASYTASGPASKTLHRSGPWRFTRWSCPLRPEAASFRCGVGGSVRDPRRGPDLAEFAGDLAPGGAGVLGDVDLAEQGEGDDAVRGGGVR